MHMSVHHEQRMTSHVRSAQGTSKMSLGSCAALGVQTKESPVSAPQKWSETGSEGKRLKRANNSVGRASSPRTKERAGRKRKADSSCGNRKPLAAADRPARSATRKRRQREETPPFLFLPLPLNPFPSLPARRSTITALLPHSSITTREIFDSGTTPSTLKVPGTSFQRICAVDSPRPSRYS